MSPNLYLSANENKALHLFSEGKSNQFVEGECTIPLSGMGFFTSEIRRKTGLSTLHSHRAVKIYSEKHLEAIKNPGLSRDQQMLVSLWLDNNLVHAIARRMQKDPMEVSNLFDDTLKKAGIFTSDDRATRLQLRIYLACFHPKNDPPSETKMKLLRLYAEGKPISQIVDMTGERELYVRVSIHEACGALGLTSRGRGAMRQLAETYFRAQETLKEIAPVTMDDPAF